MLADGTRQKDQYMDVGIFMQPIQNLDPVGKGPGRMLEECRQAIIHGDRIGFTEAWVGEHQSSDIELVTNPLIFCASLIPVTRHIKFASAVISLPIYHPAKVAVDVAMFDHMANGRFIMGVGAGAQVSDLELYDVLDKNRPEMVLESLDMIHKIWSSDPPYDFKGKYWNVKIVDQIVPELGFGPMLKPLQNPFPEIVTTIMSPHSKSAAAAGERGWGILSGNFVHLRFIKTHWEQYVIGCERSGRRPDRSKWRVARSMLVAETDAQAEEYLAREGNSYDAYYKFIYDDMGLYKLFSVMKADDSISDEAFTVRDAIDSLVIHGSPKTVLDRMIDMVDYLGGSFGTLLYTFKEWEDAAVHQRSMQLLAEEVMPKVRDYCSSKKAA